MAHDVFISHSAKDKTVGDAVCAILESKSIRCWIAPRDILPGRNWGEAIVEAISQSRVMVVVFSSQSNNSTQVVREIERAVNKGVTILPMRIEDVPLSKEMEYFISSCHWLDALVPPVEQHLHRLADTVQLLLARAAPPSSAGLHLRGKPCPRCGKTMPQEAVLCVDCGMILRELLPHGGQRLAKVWRGFWSFAWLREPLAPASQKLKRTFSSPLIPSRFKLTWLMLGIGLAVAGWCLVGIHRSGVASKQAPKPLAEVRSAPMSPERVTAQYQLGRTLLSGATAGRDPVVAVRYLRTAAEAGLAAAQNDLAVLYDKGEGVAVDVTNAVNYLRKSAEQLCPAALANLASMYEEGRGVGRDPAEAVRLWNQAAELDQPNAQWWLGSAYQTGTILTQDRREASRWLRRAAEQGHERAQQMLQELEQAVAAAAAPTGPVCDTVVLKSGEAVRGRIASETDSELVIEIANAGRTIFTTRAVPRTEIRSLEHESREHAQQRLAYEQLRVWQLPADRDQIPAVADRAIRALGDFVSLYPQSEYAANARQRLAQWKEQQQRLAYAELEAWQLTPDREQSLTVCEQAIRALREFTLKYPKSEYAPKARQRLAQWKDERRQLAAGLVKYGNRWMSATQKAQRQIKTERASLAAQRDQLQRKIQELEKATRTTAQRLDSPELKDPTFPKSAQQRRERLERDLKTYWGERNRASEQLRSLEAKIRSDVQADSEPSDAAQARPVTEVAEQYDDVMAPLLRDSVRLGILPATSPLSAQSGNLPSPATVPPATH